LHLAVGIPYAGRPGNAAGLALAEPELPPRPCGLPAPHHLLGLDDLGPHDRAGDRAEATGHARSRAADDSDAAEARAGRDQGGRRTCRHDRARFAAAFSGDRILRAVRSGSDRWRPAPPPPPPAPPAPPTRGRPPPASPAESCPRYARTSALS